MGGGKGNGEGEGVREKEKRMREKAQSVRCIQHAARTDTGKVHLGDNALHAWHAVC